MAVCTVHFHGEAIEKASAMTVLLPRKSEYKDPLPVIYLLHGLSDDHTIWTRRTSVERYVQDLPVAVVMPDTGRGFYTNACEGMAYERHIMGDVIGFVERHFNVRTDRQGRAIGGLSMGGYGSIKLALKYPDRFASVAAHSGVYDMKRFADPQCPAEFRRIFGPEPVGGPEDVFALARQVNRDQLPAIRFDCGVDDGLLPDNRALHAHLEQLGIPHEYAEFPGAHEWSYWDLHVQEAIQFHLRAFGVTV